MALLHRFFEVGVHGSKVVWRCTKALMTLTRTHLLTKRVMGKTQIVLLPCHCMHVQLRAER